MSESHSPTEGLRERKRRQTRDRIAHAARGLFLSRGFEATTIDDIAAEADISKRSFFDYFPSKEDVIAAWQDEYGGRLAEALLARPRSESMVRAVREALLTSVASSATPESIALDALVRDTPALLARHHVKYARLEARLVEALVVRHGEQERLRAALLAMVVIGGMRIGSQRWYDAGTSGDPTMAIGAFFDQVMAELRGFSDQA